MMPEYKTWRQVLNTIEGAQSSADFTSGADAKAPSRAVLAFAGIA
jgi:glycogen operon protein